MASEIGSSVPRRQLGRCLRRAREAAGIALEAAARELEWSRARMYRIEGGQTSVRSHDVLAMCRLYGIDDDLAEVLVGLARESKTKGWWQPFGEAVPAYFELYVGMESAAERARTFHAALIPGLLQIREYAEAVFRTRRGIRDGEVADAVALRLARQRVLTRGDPRPIRLEVLLDEAAVRRPIGDREAMQRQLLHLIDVARQPHVDVRVVPARIGPHPASGAGNFVVFDFPRTGVREPEPTTVYTEHLAGAAYLDRPAEVAAYEAAWRALGDLALDRSASEDLIAAVVKEIAEE